MSQRELASSETALTEQMSPMHPEAVTPLGLPGAEFLLAM